MNELICSDCLNQNIGFRDVFRYSFTVMGFENMVEHCSYNQTRNFIDSRKFTLSEEEIVSCNQWLNDYCNAPYTLLKESIDEFSWDWNKMIRQLDLNSI